MFVPLDVAATFVLCWIMGWESLLQFGHSQNWMLVHYFYPLNSFFVFDFLVFFRLFSSLCPFFSLPLCVSISVCLSVSLYMYECYCMYVYYCMCVFVCVSVYAYVYTHIYIYVDAYVYLYTRACTHAHQ